MKTLFGSLNLQGMYYLNLLIFKCILSKNYSKNNFNLKLYIKIYNNFEVTKCVQLYYPKNLNRTIILLKYTYNFFPLKI